MSKRYQSVNDFTGEITKILKGYADEVEDQTEAAIVKTAYKAESDLHVAGDFQNRSGKYRKGWTITFIHHRYGLEAIVHNKVYMLTHLLESGHAKWLWGIDTGEDVRAFPHIAQVNEEAQRMLEDELKRRME